MQRDCNIFRGSRGETCHSSIAFNYAAKLVPNILASSVFGRFFKRLLVVFKTKKDRLGVKADNFNFLKSVYCNMKWFGKDSRLNPTEVGK